MNGRQSNLRNQNGNNLRCSTDTGYHDVTKCDNFKINEGPYGPAKTSVLLYCYAFGSFLVPEGELCKGNWNWYRA